MLTLTDAGALANLLDPMPVDEFLGHSWCQALTYIPGRKGKFVNLCPWEHVNTLLETHRMDTPRLRFHKLGHELNARQFRRPSNIPGRGSVLRSSEVLKELRDGATLVIDEVEDTLPPLRDLAVSLMNFFKAPTFVNMYAGWGSNNGFALHYDPQDVFVVQVHGRKHWQVWKPTREWSMVPDVEVAPAPTGPPDFDAEITDGDVLYLPRGSWHLPHPAGEPCLHLAVCVTNWTGVDFAMWLARRLRSSATVRKDLPHLGNRIERREHTEALQRAFQEAWTSDLVDEFLQVAFDDHLQTKTRPRLSLPNLIAAGGA